MIVDFYKWDSQNIYSSLIKVDDEGPIPGQGTFTKPPKLSGKQVAQWNGSAWIKLSSAPVIEAPENPVEIINWPDLIASRRYREEISGTTVSGIPIDTGRDSQGLITGATLSAVIDPSYVCNWKTVNGFVTLDATALIGIASAMRAHVQACFDREGELLEAVEAETITQQMLNEGWPE